MTFDIHRHTHKASVGRVIIKDCLQGISSWREKPGETVSEELAPELSSENGQDLERRANRDDIQSLRGARIDLEYGVQ